jgi:hypothetical protein
MRAKGDKISRLMKQIGKFEDGFVHVPKASNWRDPYVAELTSFPNGKHDDQVDSTVNALDWMSNAQARNWIGGMKMVQAQAGSAANGLEPQPPLFPHTGPLTGSFYIGRRGFAQHDGNGIYMLSEEEAYPLRRLGFRRVGR